MPSLGSRTDDAETICTDKRPLAGSKVLPRLRRHLGRRDRAFDSVSQVAQCADHASGASLLRVFVHRWAALFIVDALMKDLPDQATEPVGDHRNRVVVSQARHVATIEQFKETALGFDRRVGRLIQSAPHLPVALRGARVLILVGTLLGAGTGADPRGQIPSGGKRRGGRADLGDDLLR